MAIKFKVICKNMKDSLSMIWKLKLHVVVAVVAHLVK
jgi:hypothetical protein